MKHSELAWKAVEAVGGKQVVLARLVDLSPAYLNQICSGARQIPVEHMAAFEAASHGAVTRQEMCPEGWRRIWPELAQQEASHV